MWGLYLFLGLLALLLLGLFVPVRLRFLFSKEQLRLTLRILGIPFRLWPRKTGRKEKVPADAPAKSAKAPKKPNAIKRIFAEHSLTESIRILCAYLRLLCERALWILKRIRFQNMRFSLTLAAGDAAETALLYGAACAAVYPLLAFLQTNLQFELKKAELRAAFEKEKTDLRASGVIAFKPITLFVAGIALAVAYLRLAKSEEQNNERK